MLLFWCGLEWISKAVTCQAMRANMIINASILRYISNFSRNALTIDRCWQHQYSCHLKTLVLHIAATPLQWLLDAATQGVVGCTAKYSFLLIQYGAEPQFNLSKIRKCYFSFKVQTINNAKLSVMCPALTTAPRPRLTRDLALINQIGFTLPNIN